MRRGSLVLALIVAVAVAATAYAAERVWDAQQSPDAARLTTLAKDRVALLAKRT